MRFYLLILLLLVLVTKALVPLFFPYRASGDQKQQIFWMYRFQDPELFTNDLLTEFMSSGKLQPPGFTFVYRMTSDFVDPLLFSKILPIILVMVSVFYMFLLGKSLGGEFAGFMAGLIFVCDVFIIGWEKHFQAGLSRGFAYPIFISFVYYFVNGKQTKASAILVLQSLFYPPIFLNSALLWGVSCIRKSWVKELKRSSIFIAGFIVAGLILVSSHKSSPTFLGPLVSKSKAKTMAEFGPDGRSDFFREHFYEYLFMGRAGLNLDKVSVYVVLLIPIGFALGKRTFRVNRIIYDIMISSSILFVIAHLVLFKLHLPSRYVLYTLPVAFILLLASNTEEFIQEIKSRYRLDLEQKMPDPKRVLGALLLLVIVMLGYQIVYSRPGREKVELYKSISTLPKDALIAGYPEDMDDIPLFSRRKVMMNMELALPYYTNYYAEIRSRTFDFFTAYYASNSSQIRGFCKKYGIDYLVVNKDHFDWKFLNGKIYYSPFGEYAKSLVEKNKTFALDNVKDSKKVFKNAVYSVVKCDEVSSD